MKTIKHFSFSWILGTVALAALGLVSAAATAATVDATYNSATDVPVTATGYSATGNTVNFTLNFAPATGTDLMVVSNTALDFINGTFDNLTNGQSVALNYGGRTYRFVANYYGGSGNDLMLVWASNRAFAWGWNAYGQLGDNTTNDCSLPVPVTTTGVLAGKTVVAVAPGMKYSMALSSDGTVAAWGRGTELGTGSTNTSWVPVAVDTSANSALHDKRVVTIAAGQIHGLALCSDGTVAGWGWNGTGLLGDNTTSNRFFPVATVTTGILAGKTVVAIAAGGYHSLALCSDGTVAAWGLNGDGQLGDNQLSGSVSYVPVAVNTGTNSALYGKTVVAIAAGDSHSLALCSDGTVAAWGWNWYGQLGDNTTTNHLVPLGVNTTSGLSALHGKTVIAIAAGVYHSLALCSDGTIAAWGSNPAGQLGDGTSTDRLAPVAVNTTTNSVLHDKTVVAIAAGYVHTLALCSDGTAAAWGDNGRGQLGDNKVSGSRSLVPIAVNTNLQSNSRCYTHLSAGIYGSLALVAAPPAGETMLSGAQSLTNGAFQFFFTNTPGAFFGALATTDPALPQSDWTPLTDATEVSPGKFQFTDPQATNTPHRFYRIRSP